MTDKSQLEQVREQADALGVSYHHRAGVAKIQGLINTFLVAQNAEQNTTPSVTPGSPARAASSDANRELMEADRDPPAPGTVAGDPKFLARDVEPTGSRDYHEREKRERKRTVGKLIRCRIQNMNPLKKDWPGEILSVGSATLGTFKKYIPFGGGEAYHVPKIMYDMMKDKQCSAFFTSRDSRGRETRKSRLINEYNIEVLPDLSKEELDELQKKQAVQAANQI